MRGGCDIRRAVSGQECSKTVANASLLLLE